MQKLFVTSLAVAGLGYFGYQAFKDKFKNATKAFIKENFSVRLSGLKIHKLDFKGVDVRITLDLINLSSITAKAENIRAELFYMKNGSPSPLATTTFPSTVSIAPKDTTRIPDMRIVAPLKNLLYNYAMLSDTRAEYKVVLTATVNGQTFTINQNFSRYEPN
ncbi:hypothetical protein KDU71_02500 [Carboxylicivirga sediminis]|uniref:Uncharacterized protein n=1 Tax=Carboxylicivirga sediminis TaxID=2006564 RepID=A0A941F286_9BACT|nr:hypothetical protein [Carboxylicivirga sediminis]MBR8534415.1 hypothetical protein [Carboxylicivirga sediminis]